MRLKMHDSCQGCAAELLERKEGQLQWSCTLDYTSPKTVKSGHAMEPFALKPTVPCPKPTSDVELTECVNAQLAGFTK